MQTHFIEANLLSVNMSNIKYNGSFILWDQISSHTLLVELTRPAGELTVLDTRVDILLSRDQFLINNQFRITLATAQITLATDRSREIARETKWGGSLP